MANLTVTIPDSAVPRLRTAMGHFDGSLVWVDATQQEVLDRVKQYLKSQVINYESTKAAEQDRATRSSESW
jgi:hypothetical protein